MACTPSPTISNNSRRVTDMEVVWVARGVRLFTVDTGCANKIPTVMAYLQMTCISRLVKFDRHITVSTPRYYRSRGIILCRTCMFVYTAR